MTDREYARKYLLKDIVKYNLHYFWILLLCAVLGAAGLGYRSYAGWQNRFDRILLEGTVNRISVEYYTGNIVGETLLFRNQSLITVMHSKAAYDEMVRLSGYDLTYETFHDMMLCDNDGTRDCVSAMLQYPYGSDGYSVLTDDDAEQFMQYYAQAVENTCDKMMGEGKVYRLGIGEPQIYVNEISDDQKSAAIKSIIKNAFIGGVIGLIIPVVVLTLIYLLNGTLRTAPEIAYYADTRLLASVRKDRMSELDKLAPYFRYVSGKDSFRICLIGITNGVEAVASGMSDMLQKYAAEEKPFIGNYEFYFEDMEKTPVNAVTTACESDVVILLAATGKIKEDNIMELVRLLSLYNVKINGVIVYES